MSDRVIVYSGAIPLETDILRTNKYQMMGLAKLAASVFGTSSVINGLSCGPTSPASLSVNISPGEMYSLANVDSTAYSSLSADTTHSVLKQAISLDTTTLTLTPPTTAGYSVNYLVQFAFQETDTDPATLAYYNASNPSQAWSGPSNSGVAQYTTRSCNIAITLKQGVAAATGSQSTPAADVGYVAGWVVTVANGQTAITSANISPAANAPFLQSSGIVKATQNNSMCFSVDTGSANAYSVQYFPPVTTLVDGMELSFRALNANTTSSTFSPNGLTAYPIITHLNQALTGGEIVSGGLVTVKYDATLASWIIHGSTGSSAATSGRLLAIRTFSTAGSGTYTPTAGTKKAKIIITGGGGGGGGCAGSSTSQTVSGAGGGAGGTCISLVTISSSSYAYTVGAAGAGGSGATGGSNGGDSTIAGLTANGGVGGRYSSATNTAGGSGGGAAGGSVIIQGGAGSDGQASAFVFAGNGGGSYFGSGGRAGAAGGIAGQAYGAGGGGAYDPGLTGTSYSGGAGKAGFIYIEEYA